MSDELFEIEEARRMGREEAAALLRRLADQLARHNEIEVVRGGIRMRVDVPAEVEVEVEVEVTTDGGSIEVEIEW